MGDQHQSNLDSHAAMILMTDNTLVERCFEYSNDLNMAPTRSVFEPPSLHPTPACSPSDSSDLTPPVRIFNDTVDVNYHNASLAGPTTLARAHDSIPKDPGEIMMHRRSESPGLNELDFHVAPLQQTSYTSASSVPPLMLPSQTSPSFCGSTYGSQENLSERKIVEVSSSPPNVVTLDNASSPPSSSPSQIFSSSPLASSQVSEPYDDLESEKSNEFQIQRECIQNETDCVIGYDSPQFSANATNYFDLKSSSSDALCLPVAFLSTNSLPHTGEVLIEPVSASHSQLTNLNLEQVSSDVLEGLISPLSTPNPGFFDHVTPLVADTLINDSSVESCPLALLSTQLLQPAAQPLELGLLHDTHQTVALELSPSISSAVVTPHSNSLPRSSPSGQLSPSSIPMEIELADVHQEYISVPATGFTKYQDEENSAPGVCLDIGKRKRGLEDVDTNSKSQVQNKNARVSVVDAEKIMDPSPGQEIKKPDLPNPKRLTIASQKQQHRKLAAPFRSPVLKRPRQQLNIPTSPPERGRSLVQVTQNRPAGTLLQMPDSAMAENEIIGEKKRHRTQRAAAQFKSPLSTDASLNIVPSVRLTPTIQAQERKLQILKRAIKVQRDGEEETLKTLLKKWTEAGREVAWEVWELVKDNERTDDRGSKAKPSRKSIEDGWGWNETTSEKERNWGWDVVPNTKADPNNYTGPIECEDEEEKRQDTLGTMLMQLGIAPETLGWNDDEENFEAE